jgi:hypothetical protein
MSCFGDARPGGFRGLRDVATAFEAPANHTFLVKFSYWLNR